MDPISAIFVMTVLGGLFVKGVDLATDGLFSVEVGAGVRGAGGYAARAGRARWRLARSKAREIRMRTPQGRAVQEFLDIAGMFVRVLSGEAVRFGSGVRSGFRSGRDQARSARTERRGGEPWPIVRAARSGRVRAQEWAERRARSGAGTPNEDPNEPGPTDPNGTGPDWYRVTITTRRFGWASVRVDYLGARTNPPQLLTTFDEGYGVSGAVREATDYVADEQARHGGAYRIEWVVDGSEPTTDLPVSPYAADPNGASSAAEPEPNTTTAADPNDGCLHVTTWVITPTTLAGPGYREPRYCGEPREPGWVLCPTHLADRRADPDCPQEDIDEYRADPDHLGPDAFRSIPDPNGDPNVPLESTVPNQNGDVRCGCCALLHRPLAPGQHCPACHIHDHPSQSPNGTIPNAPATRGPSMDITSAPAAIAAWEAFAPRWESLQSRADALQGEIDSLKNAADTLHGEIATLADGMGDFAVGGEVDTAAAVGELSDAATSAKERADVLVDSIGTAKQAVDAHVDRLHDDFDPSIEAAAGQVADAHAVMQEA